MIETYYYGPQTAENNKIVGDFVSTIIWGKTDQVRDYCTMAVVKDGQLIAGTMYYDWHPEHGVIQLSSGSINKLWLTRKVIRAMFSMPFERLGCQMCVLRVSERNSGMVKIARDFGFDEYRIPRLGGRDEAEILFTLTDDAWKAHRINREF